MARSTRRDAGPRRAGTLLTLLLVVVTLSDLGANPAPTAAARSSSTSPPASQPTTTATLAPAVPAVGSGTRPPSPVPTAATRSGGPQAPAPGCTVAPGGSGPRPDLGVRPGDISPAQVSESSDWDGDGRPDQLSITSDTVSLGWNGGSVTVTGFPADEGPAGPPASAPAAILADLTGDGRPDLVVAAGGDVAVVVGGSIPATGATAVGFAEIEPRAFGWVSHPVVVPRDTGAPGRLPSGRLILRAIGDVDHDGVGDLAAITDVRGAGGPWAVYTGKPCLTGGVTSPAPPAREIAGGVGNTPDATATEPTVGRPAVYAGDFPDPALVRDDLTYYAYGTNVTDVTGSWLNVPTLVSDDLEHWRGPVDALPTVGSWTEGQSGLVWAPAVQRFGAEWVMYYSARSLELDRMCIGRATSSAPTGPFVDSWSSPLVCQADLGGSIDPSTFTDGSGETRLLWKSDGNCCGQPVSLWSQPLTTDGLSLSGSPTALLDAPGGWDGSLIEGPAVVAASGSDWLLYSGGNWKTAEYSTGYASCPDPSSTCTNLTPTTPWLTSTTYASGTGGMSVVDAGLSGLWIGYHGWNGGVGYESGGVRSLFVDHLVTGPDGPALDSTAPFPGTPLGSLDRASMVPGGAMVVQGWAIDPDQGGPARVTVTVDGTAFPVVADQTRADVGAVRPAYGAQHGFGLTIAEVGAGTHTVCAAILDDEPDAPPVPLGCRTVLTPSEYLPFGALDTVAAAAGTSIVAHGWAIDPDQIDPARVRVTVDGAGVFVLADQARADVGAAFPAYGLGHGYAVTLTNVNAGTHTVCAEVLDASLGIDTPVGCTVVTV